MFISLDLETTGFNNRTDKIIEFGAVKFDLNGFREEMQFLINPNVPIPQIVTHITNIEDKDIKDAPTFEEKREEIQAFIGDLPIVGHNIQFDTGFLRANGIPLTNPEYDTCILASIACPGQPSYSLEILSSVLNLSHEEKHRALDDAVAAMELFLKLTEEFQALPKDMLEKIQNLVQKSNWPVKDYISALKPNQKAKSEVQESKNEINKLEEAQKQLIDTNTTALIEMHPPYDELAKTLSEHADKDSYIALPYSLFKQVESQIPDSVAKIDIPSRYISLERLKEFEKQEFFEDYEISALIKFLIWVERTKTGLLSEVKLFNEENNVTYKVNISESIDNPEEEDFYKKALQKDENACAIITHQYLAEYKPKIKDLILIDLESFSQNLFFQNSGYLKLEIMLSQLSYFMPNPIAETLHSKTTILFGLIGMFFEKYNDKQDMYAKCMISEHEIAKQEWENIKESVKGIFEASKDLSDLNIKENFGYLKNWKRSLKTLQDFFLKPDLKETLLWIEQNPSEETILKIAPYSTKEHTAQVLNNSENYKIINDIVDLNDNGLFVKKLHNLPEDLQVIKKQKPQNVQILIANDAPKDQEKHQMKKFLNRILKGRTAILSSKQQLDFFTVELDHSKLKMVSQTTGGLGKIRQQMKNDPDNSVLLLNNYMWDQFENYELIDTLIILKVPFDAPSNPYIQVTSRNFSDPFNDFQIPKAAISLHKIISKLKPESKVIMLDSRLTTKKYGQFFLDTLATITKTEFFSIDFFEIDA